VRPSALSNAVTTSARFTVSRFAIRDKNRVAGVRTTFGSPAFADHVPEHDDVVVSRLREAGAIILGKTNSRIRP